MVGRQGGLRVQLVAALVLLQTCTAINYYSELGVRRTASLADIKSAYRELARSNHPDKNKGADAQARFQRVAAAYETLSNPENRRQYDLYGDDYASIGRQAEQQRQFRSQYNDPFRRGRSRGPPIFSETLSLTSENHADLAEGQGETWLLQFYHDWSEPCKEFAPKWEALARKLPPMVRLARLNIDQNFGLLQRYRSFLRCRQTAFSLGVECTTPALVLVTPSVDGPPTGEAYHGALQAEHIYEWLKRSFASRPSAIREVRAGSSLPPLALGSIGWRALVRH
jgi:thiol-disulfide isomerase/thioredoxin